jgi:myo-inositol-1(or 4)-monophosphatase
MANPEDVLKTLILAAGRKLRHHFGRVRTVQFKAGSVTNMVTNVDQEVEEYIKKRIRLEFPDDSILAEESPLEKEDAPRRWIIDPIDGTTNFAHGLPLFCLSIGVEVQREVVLGAVYDPIHKELFFAKKGQGASMNDSKISVSGVDSLEKSLLVTGFPYDIHEHPERSLPYFNAVIQKAQGLRRLGSAALDLCYLAMGRFDGFFEVSLNAWDTAAGMLILTEAGGTITDFDGHPYSIYQRELAASNGKIHASMLSVIQSVKSNISSQKLNYEKTG